MTSHDESWNSSEITMSMLLLKTRATIDIGAWDVRAMWGTGRIDQIAMEMVRYNLAVLGISTTHWMWVGQKWLDSRGVVVLRSWGKKCYVHTRSCIDAVQRGTKTTYKTEVSWVQNHQSNLQNRMKGSQWMLSSSMHSPMIAATTIMISFTNGWGRP